MVNALSIDIRNVKGIGHLKIDWLNEKVCGMIVK